MKRFPKPPPPAPAPVWSAATPTPPPPPQVMPAFLPIQRPAPPPPPPLPPAIPVQTVCFWSDANKNVFTGNVPQSATSLGFPVNQPPPPVLPMFDASRPPPPIPAYAKNAVKRRMNCQAGPSKVRIHERPEDADGPCVNCAQKELRICVYKEKVDKVLCEFKQRKQIYQIRLKEYESGKAILRAIVRPELYKILEEHVEGKPPQLQEILAQYNHNHILSLMEYIFTNTHNEFNSVLSPAFRMQDQSSSLRANNPINHSTSEFLDSLIQIVRKSNTEREFANGQTNERLNPVTNTSQDSMSRMINRNMTTTLALPPIPESSAAPAPARAPQYTAPAPQYPVPTPQYPAPAPQYPATAPQYPARAPRYPDPAPLYSAPAPLYTAPASLYPAYHPTVLPPTNQPCYPQPYNNPALSTSTPMSNNVTHNTTSARIGVSVPHQMSAQSSTSAAAPSMPSHYNQYMMGRYPHPPQYYPPYQ